MITKVKASTIEAIVDALCSSESITKAEIIQRARVSSSTVSKVISALLDSGLIVEQRACGSNGGTSASRLSLSNKIHTAVIDLSSPIYSFNIISGGRSRFRYTQPYDSSTDFAENLYSLLSRAISNARIAKGSRLCFCVLYSDNKSNCTTSAYLPGTCDKDIIDGAVYDVLKHTPYTYISKSQAISNAVRSNIIGRAEGYGGVSYLFIGSSISAFSVSNDEKLICPDIRNLIIDGNTTAERYLDRCITRNDFEHLLMATVNFIDTAFRAPTLIIESDTFNVDESNVKVLARHYASARLTLPTIYPVYSGGNEPDACVLSAARYTESAFFKAHLLRSK